LVEPRLQGQDHQSHEATSVDEKGPGAGSPVGAEDGSYPVPKSIQVRLSGCLSQAARYVNVAQVSAQERPEELVSPEALQIEQEMNEGQQTVYPQVPADGYQ